MSDGTSDFDLTQFYGVFFEEAAENLENFERLLLGLDVQAPAEETLHAIFRCAHSVKGGAATFGFANVAELTHAMETLLDQLRRHEQPATTDMVDTLLKSGDLLRALLHCHQHGGVPPDAGEVLQALAAHTQAPGGAASHAPAAPQPKKAARPRTQKKKAAAALPPGERELAMTVGPLADPSLADDILELFGEVAGGGTLERVDGAPEKFARFHLRTSSSDADILDLCSFHVPRESIALAPWEGEPEDAAQEAGPAPAMLEVAAAEVRAVQAPAAAPASAPVAAQAAGGGATPRTTPSETLRVSLEKVDQLINLMGELVITQAMLAQKASRLDAQSREHLMAGLSDLERTTRDLQESVMSIRMIPMSDVFNRFPRMLRDLAARLGKQLELKTVGEATEMDKGLIEKITDPLTHLVRNSVDHGIELPAERIEMGKPPQGTLTLSACHEGGCIVIEVRDDGRGLDRERILDKARRNGMALPDNMTDGEVYQLIFAPGFSTAEAVTDISGRGVGMDVVRRNILGLGGTVELDSELGRGTCVRVRLPLTLAIMDGMSVGIEDDLYLLPLSSVVESFQPQPGAIRTMANRHRVVKVREDHLPVLSLAEAMGYGPVEAVAGAAAPMLVLVQAEGRQVALEVERLVGQQQVVVKNLETNYRKVQGVSGATIMGDGSVALILDVGALVRRAHDKSSSPAAGGRRDERGLEPAGTHAAEPIPA